MRSIGFSLPQCVVSCSVCSADSPLLWIRIDPDMSILRKVEFEQADFMWQYQLRYERDVVAQVASTLAFNFEHFQMNSDSNFSCCIFCFQVVAWDLLETINCNEAEASLDF